MVLKDEYVLYPLLLYILKKTPCFHSINLFKDNINFQFKKSGTDFLYSAPDFILYCSAGEFYPPAISQITTFHNFRILFHRKFSRHRKQNTAEFY